MELNKYQTPIEDLVYNKVVDGKMTPIKFKDAPQEVQEDFMEYFSTVPLIQWLVSKERPYCKDLPRDEKGRAIWRIEQPPIIEDMEYFCPTAIHYMKTGRLTDLRPNPNPNSAYRKWQDEEVRRIRYGYLRKEDGAYIPGRMYWSLNYSPIILTKKIGKSETGYRTMGFPEPWEGVLWRYIGWELARSLGQHFGEISSRGKSKSYTLAAELNRIFVIGDKYEDTLNHLDKENARAVVMAYQKEFLIKDGTLNKFEDMFDFTAQNTQFPRKTLTRSLGNMDWVMGYTDLNTGAKKGTGNEVMGVAVKDEPGKARGKRAQLIGLEEFGTHWTETSVPSMHMVRRSGKEMMTLSAVSSESTFRTAKTIRFPGVSFCTTGSCVFVTVSKVRLKFPTAAATASGDLPGSRMTLFA